VGAPAHRYPLYETKVYSVQKTDNSLGGRHEERPDVRPRRPARQHLLQYCQCSVVVQRQPRHHVRQAPQRHEAAGGVPGVVPCELHEAVRWHQGARRHRIRNLRETRTEARVQGARSREAESRAACPEGAPEGRPSGRSRGQGPACPAPCRPQAGSAVRVPATGTPSTRRSADQPAHHPHQARPRCDGGGEGEGDRQAGCPEGRRPGQALAHLGLDHDHHRGRPVDEGIGLRPPLHQTAPQKPANRAPSPRRRSGQKGERGAQNRQHGGTRRSGDGQHGRSRNELTHRRNTAPTRSRLWFHHLILLANPP